MTTTTQISPSDDPQTARAQGRLGMVLQDKWKLEALLGVGGMAAVYAATHRNGKRVAVKMLHGELSHDEEVKRRFLQEGYAANTIQHEGAVSVLDDDVAPDGSAFIVMELLEGETLEQRWERNAHHLPPREVLAIVEQLLDVLAAAHAKNVVHRDIKPENLFLTKGGVVKVLDFGIARVLEATQARSSTSTRAGMVMGTPAFMAPEQALAHWDKVDGRTDLWAVGATMYTLLVGRHVHEGDSGNEQLVRAATQAPQSVSTVVRGLPPSIVHIVDKAIAFEQDARWPDAATMQQAVREALDAMGGAESLAQSGRRTMSSSGMQSPVHTGAPTIIDPSRAATASSWSKELQTRAADASRLRASITDLTQKFAAAKKGAAEAQARVEAGRAERKSLEQQFTRQVGTRTAAVEEARRRVRVQMVTLARKAIEDHAIFGADMDPTREQIAKLERAAEAAKRDVDVHTAALHAYDPRAMKLGVVLLGVLAALALALVVVPIVWRATRVVEPPVPVAPAPT
jgi:eukaryotic-like serine/threonine-protein kinase